jgi:hypothetical protein
MGKTTLWSKGIEKMLQIMKRKEKSEFYPILKKCYQSKHVIHLDFTHFSILPRDEANEAFLCNCIIRSLGGDFELPDTIRLLELLKFLSALHQNSFFILVFDEAQELFPPVDSDDWRFSRISKLVSTSSLSFSRKMISRLYSVFPVKF